MKRKMKYAIIYAVLCAVFIFIANFVGKNSPDFDFINFLLQVFEYLIAIGFGIGAVAFAISAIKTHRKEKIAAENAKMEEALSRKATYNDYTYVPGRFKPKVNDIKQDTSPSITISFDFGSSDKDPAENVCDIQPKALRTLFDYQQFKDYIFLDTETTGLSRQSDYIVEIAMIKYKGGVEVDRFSTLVKPPIHIPAEATAVNGITDSDVASAPQMEKISKDIASFIEENYYIVGHNVSFDLAFLVRECADALTLDYLYYVDTITLAKKAFPYMPNYKLETLLSKLEISNQQEHRALQDVEATVSLFKICYDKIYADLKSLDLEERKKRAAERAAKQKELEKYEASPLYMQKFVFTGEFSFERDQCEATLSSVGALHRTSVSKQTNYLVVGKNEYDTPSTKLQKAQELIDAGTPIQIISEEQYLALIRNAKEALAKSE